MTDEAKYGYCDQCGKALILRGTTKGSHNKHPVYFDSDTGRAIVTENWSCPNANWYNNHADYYHTKRL